METLERYIQEQRQWKQVTHTEKLDLINGDHPKCSPVLKSIEEVGVFCC